MGLDIGGTKLAAGLVNRAGEVFLRATAATEAQRGGPKVLDRALELVDRLIREGAEKGLPAPQAVGIASAGRIDTVTGKVAGSSGLLTDWEGLGLTESFESHFSIPAQADNDVNALALAESLWGAGQGFSEALFLAAGTGLGGGLIMNGQLQRGANYCAGEVGHTLFSYNGWLCECGKRGCLEQYTASGAIIRYYRQYQAGDSPITVQAIAQLAQAEPTGPAARAFEEAGQLLGVGLASLVCTLDPQAIIIGGGLVAASPLYFSAACAAFAAHAWPAQAHTPITKAKLAGNAPIVGAAALVFEQIS
jgi:predicted NBD/HSP70 family sugar kinase